MTLCEPFALLILNSNLSLRDIKIAYACELAS